MSHEPGSDRTTTDVVARLQHATQELERRVREARRRQHLTLVLGAVAVVICAFCLHHASGQIRKLDPEAVAQIGRHELESRLPEGRELMGQYLVDHSPELVAGFLDSLEETFPRLRVTLEGHVESEIDRQAAHFETWVVDELGARIATHKRSIDTAYPGRGDEEKLRLLISSVASDFSTVFDQAVEQLYPKFSSQLSRIERQIDATAGTEPHLLTRRERMEQEILSIILGLMVQEHHRSGARTTPR